MRQINKVRVSPASLRGRAGRAPAKDRGVASVVSMMFLILFGSLAAAMAIASRGNIKTAATHIHVMRAFGAAETGLEIARVRLQESASRFVVASSTVDQTFGENMWSGSTNGMGSIVVLPPPSGYSEGSSPAGIINALANQHAADQNIVSEAAVSSPTIANAMAGADEQHYGQTDWLYTPAIALEASADDGLAPLCFSIVYAPLANGTDVRAIVTGYDYAYTRNGQPITRTVMQDFRIAKRVNHAVISPSRIMIGKNVSIAGDIGARFETVAAEKGDPLVIKSDFLGLDPVLDQKIVDFMTVAWTSDVDGDNRLRVGHPVEGAAIPSNTRDYDGDGQADGAFADATRDGYVDDFDLFINHYDTNRDGKVVLSEALTAGTPAAGLSAEFLSSGGTAIDDDLALLIDANNPDRNRNGVSGYVDTNSNGRWDADEPFNDHDTFNDVNRDQMLGYRDGVIDRKDAYAKIAGRLMYKTSHSAWTTAQGSYNTRLYGSVRPSSGKAPTLYSANDSQLPAATNAIFSDAQNALLARADGRGFSEQVRANLGNISSEQLAIYVETQAADRGFARYFRVDADANLDGRPDNWDTAYWEKMPFNGPTATDYYYRPVYENMVFKDVVIPAGTNALFKNCTFVGVTYVRTNTTNSHRLWSEYGKMEIAEADGHPIPKTRREVIYGDDAGEANFPAMLPASATPPNQLIQMVDLTRAVNPEDKGDLPSTMTGIDGYNLLPDPLVISGKRVVDTKVASNNLRFDGCLFVGSIVSDNPGVYTQARNKIQFTGATRFTETHPDRPDDSELNPQDEDRSDIAKSSMMLPNYSVDIGSFNSPPSQSVRLRGAIVAGVMDIRGNTSIDGALLLTFAPERGVAPMLDVLGNPLGNPAGFNTTIGYFGPDDGDEESLDPNNLPVVNGQKIVGWDTDGDGIVDVQPPGPAPGGATAIPFYGYGGISIRHDPSMALPDGVMLPLQYDPLPTTYREGKP